ncbi:MAG: hypothetical protein Q9183_003573 [Haloplaca sp. 2 TL-2023]
MAIEGIPERMLAAQVVEYNKPYKISGIPTPTSLDKHDLLIKVKVASYCHTDSMVAAGVYSTALPCTASHEAAGEVVALGGEVKIFKIGDRVMAGIPMHRCGNCSHCQGPEDLMLYCQNMDGFVGVTTGGGAFAEYMIVDARESCVVPQKVTYETAAPLACAGITIWNALARAALKKGETVALVGAGGGLGHLGCQFAKAMGLQVVGIDARDEALALAQRSGASNVFDARIGKEKMVEEVKKVTDGGKGVDCAITMTEAPAAAAMACAITKMHELMIQLAQPTNVEIPFHELIFRDLRIHSSLIAPRYEARRMLEFVAEHDIGVTTNVFHGLQEIPKLLDLVQSGRMVGKGVVVVDADESKNMREKRIG